MPRISPMTAADLDHVLALEARCHLQPWSAELFRKELENPLSRIDLLWIDDSLAGYLCTWSIGDELHIHNVVTEPGFRRRGVARTLLEGALSRGLEEGLKRAFLEVRAGNEGAIALYRSFGFETTGRRPRYYSDGEDAWMMERVLLPGND
jgi:[ribosomal protein S18]-alanine N-acetyltransferase